MNESPGQRSHIVREVLREVILCLLIKESKRIRGKEGEEEEPRRTGFLDGTKFLGAMIRRLNRREREREVRYRVTTESKA